MNPTDTLKRGAAATTRRTPFGGGEAVTIVRAEYLPTGGYADVNGTTVPVGRERWLHVRFADGARLLMHPSNLEAARIPAPTEQLALPGLAVTPGEDADQTTIYDHLGRGNSLAHAREDLARARAALLALPDDCDPATFNAAADREAAAAADLAAIAAAIRTA